MFPPGPAQAKKANEVIAGTERLYGMAKKHNLKVAFGTDALFSASMARMQGRVLASLLGWYRPAEILRQATGTNAELLALSGKRAP